MKKLIGIVALSFAVISAPSNAKTEDQAYCESLSKLAGIAMHNRQESVDYMEMLLAAGDNELAVGIINMAYSTPEYYSDSAKKKAVAEFKNKIAIHCMSARSSK